MNTDLCTWKRTILGLIATGCLVAGPMAFASIAKLANQADAVIVGAVQQATVSGVTVSLSIRVIRALKGTPQEGDLIYATWSAATMTQVPATVGNPCGVWFMKSSTAGWTIQPTAVGDVNFSNIYLPVPSGPLDAVYQISPTASVTDKIANEIAAAIDVTNGRSPLMLPLQLGWLDIVNSPVLQQALVRFGSSGVAPLQTLGLQGLIRGGDAPSLAKVASTPILQADPSVVSAVCDYRNADVGGIGALGALTSTNLPVAMRTCAAHALRNIHTKETLLFLAALLDGDTSDLRYEGVAGLASFANNFPIQTPANTANMGYLTSQGKTQYSTDDVRKNFPGKGLFQQQESTYIAFWKTWWAGHQTEF